MTRQGCDIPAGAHWGTTSGALRPSKRMQLTKRGVLQVGVPGGSFFIERALQLIRGVGRTGER